MPDLYEKDVESVTASVAGGGYSIQFSSLGRHVVQVESMQKCSSVRKYADM